MLNLFAYTCPFTVAAAVGGASRTVSIDASGRALEMGRANVENATDEGAHEFLKADVFDALDDLARRGERFDLIVVDPPTYSTTRGARWTSGKAWVDLATRALGVAEKSGRVLCCSNDRRLSERKFERYLRAALRADGRRGRVKTHAPPADFPPPPGGAAHLKTGVIELR
jgi:23S rRNA (cytosine1962-C5)-methyltransferase